LRNEWLVAHPGAETWAEDDGKCRAKQAAFIADLEAFREWIDGDACELLCVLAAWDARRREKEAGRG